MRPAPPRRLPAVLTMVVVASAMLTVASTWRVFSQTYDEGVHIAAGLEWLDRGVFELEELTPPLGRIAGGLGPWCLGIPASRQFNHWKAGNEVLHADGRYWRNLAAARAGHLPFVALLALSVWCWTRRRTGPWGAFAAVLAALSLPSLLGNAGLAATDFPLAATATFAFWRLEAWLAAPSFRRAVLFGLGAALALLTKFSAIPFLALGAALVLTLRLLLPGEGGPTRARLLRGTLSGAPWVLLAAALTVWAGYRFSRDPVLRDPARAPAVAARFVGARGPLHDGLTWLIQRRLFPARALFLGIKEVPRRNALGHKTFFDGRVEYGGRLDFFPRLLAIKTPLPFLALLAASLALAIGDRRRRADWRTWTPLACAGAVLWTGMTGNLILGTRLVLAVLPALAVTIGAGVVALAARGRVARGAIAVLFAWQLAGTARAWPDEMAWFNELAPREPMWLTTSGDLDFAQDLGRMCDTLRARRVDRVWMAYSGSADLARHPLPPHRLLAPHERVSGWVAISANTLMAGRWEDRGEDTRGYRWLLEQPLVARVGRSMFLYRVAGADTLGR